MNSKNVLIQITQTDVEVFLDDAPKKWSVIDYCAEEVQRQGHDVTKVDGIERVGWMLNAWTMMIHAKRDRINLTELVELGRTMEPSKNSYGLRRCNVTVGPYVMPHWQSVLGRLTVLLAHQETYASFDFYREFLEIHPFEDGNGRVGKILLNWKNGSLQSPIFPPNDFWGASIVNP